MSDWDSASRDAELHHISTVTKGVVAVAVGGTVLLGAGIAWGDQQRVEQANNREAAPQDQPSPGTNTIKPPATQPTPTATSGGSTGGTSKSGGS